ncbi:DUF1906 domain-containing protein [Clostridium felsineum]|uniref:glycoside hydrolase domain-containing protein n=1 Tax=Clostridium felsineum TaxID=36839 RepID=UPI00214D3FE0|nr:glycoside hydrolase domain-containing protein [Clostridium felsineum]MCR3761736.1 DUF1906 domain-containing protein [Clostridium felsineum]
MDQLVLKIQQWLNKTYSGKTGYTQIPEDGVTGWGTIKGLIIGLQIELGISSPNGSFGPATSAAFKNLEVGSTKINQVYILQGALFCKGYNPGGFTGTFGDNTKRAVVQLQSDAGLSNQIGVVTPLLMKSLLSMDAFVLLNYDEYNGDPNIRIIQQNLNHDYSSNNYFASNIGLVPCDGIYGRSTNKALLYALQIEEGISVPNGVFGPTTKNRCPILSLGSTNTKFIYLLQYTLYCNGFNPNGFTGQFESGTKEAVTNFQNFTCLSADGTVGMQTWASLLVSTGDSSRKGTMCDCSTTITNAKAKTLVTNGYKSVGRYLTGKFKMTANELNIISNSGLKVFPIFETGGYKLEYFTSLQGNKDAKNAISLASSFGFDSGTIIYFCVDYDALGTDINNAILPYFSEIYQVFKRTGTTYKIGIYAPRSVCSKVSDAGYSCSSFVCDMSSGFSGNLGYPLPKDWSIDQISTISLGIGDGAIEIDNNISSGRDLGVAKVTPGNNAAGNTDTYPAPSEQGEIQGLLESLYSIAEKYSDFGISPYDTALSRNIAVLDLLREQKYGDWQWIATVGPVYKTYIDYVKANYSDVYNKIYPYIKAGNDARDAYINNKCLDLPHIAATLEGYNSSPIVPDFYTGWGGDLATAMADVTKLKYEQDNKITLTNKTVREFAEQVIGSSDYSCSRLDIEGDIDAISLSEIISDDNIEILFDGYFKNVSSLSRRNFLLSKFGYSHTPTSEELYEHISSIILTGTFGIDNELGVALKSKATYKVKDANGNVSKIEPTTEIEQEIVRAFAEYILNKL